MDSFAAALAQPSPSDAHPGSFRSPAPAQAFQADVRLGSWAMHRSLLHRKIFGRPPTRTFTGVSWKLPTTYTYRFGGAKVVQSDVLHATPDNPQATIVADLTCADDLIPSQEFDCIILTQTLEVIYESRAVLRTLIQS